MNKIQLKPILLTLALPLTATVILHLACKKATIELTPHGPTEQIYFSTEAEFARGVYGVYAKLTDYYGWVNTDGAAGPTSTLMPIFTLMGDDITTVASGEPFEQFGNLQPSEGRISAFYKTCYQLIARANVMIEKITQVEDGIYNTPGLKDWNLGEVYFLRGFAYYYLWNYFGTSPITNERVTSPDQFFPESTEGTALLDQAITDFTQAAGLLPESWDASNAGRATRNAANGFLGKSLVFRASATNTAADYTAALTALNAVAGVSLVPEFGDNFAFDTENNAESLFEFQASEAPGNNIWLNNDFDNAIGNLAIAWNHYDNRELYENPRFTVTTKLAAAFEADDPRIASTFDPANRNVTKYVSRDMSALGWQNASVNNYRLLRFADILLLRAEALVQSGGSTADAVGLINQVRERARGGGSVPANLSTGETDRTTIMNWIMNERFLEFAGEGQRWLDIRRWHMQGLITLTGAFFSSSIVTGSVGFAAPQHLLLPIPNSERDVNVNVRQNTGY